jgi:hypothetical protein
MSFINSSQITGNIASLQLIIFPHRIQNFIWLVQHGCILLWECIWDCMPTWFWFMPLYLLSNFFFSFVDCKNWVFKDLSKLSNEVREVSHWKKFIWDGVCEASHWQTTNSSYIFQNFIIVIQKSFQKSVQIRPQVHISEKLSVLGLIRHNFILCKKGVSVVWKGLSILYKLLFASSTKQCETILVYLK